MSITTSFIVSPWDFWIVSAAAGLIGNWVLITGHGMVWQEKYAWQQKLVSILLDSMVKVWYILCSLLPSNLWTVKLHPNYTWDGATCFQMVNLLYYTAGTIGKAIINTDIYNSFMSHILWPAVLDGSFGTEIGLWSSIYNYFVFENTWKEEYNTVVLSQLGQSYSRIVSDNKQNTLNIYSGLNELFIYKWYHNKALCLYMLKICTKVNV